MNTSNLVLSTSLLLASTSTLALHAQGGSLGALEADRFGCEADRSHQGSETNDHMGFDMDAGDWNGDGIDDLLVAGAPGSPYDPSNRAFECPEAPPPAPLIKGRAFIFAGTDPDDWATEPPFSLWAALEGDEEGDRSGWEVAGVGRLGDEPAVGDPFYSANGNEQGAVYAYSWDRASASVVPTFIGLVPITLSLDEPDPNNPYQDDGARFGWDVDVFDQVAFGGQYNPHFDDAEQPEFLVGALTNGQSLVAVANCGGALQGGRTNGRAFVLSIAVPAPPDQPFVVVQCVYFGAEPRARLGSSVATGDFDGDGRPDVATGSTGYTDSSAATEVGRIHFFKNLSTEP